MTSYDIGGTLCNNSDHAALTIVGNWIWGINSAEDVAAMTPQTIVAEMDGEIEFQAHVVGKKTEDGEDVYHDVTPTNARLMQMVTETIDEAKAFVNND